MYEAQMQESEFHRMFMCMKYYAPHTLWYSLLALGLTADSLLQSPVQHLPGRRSKMLDGQDS